MAADSFMPRNDFGIISSNIVPEVNQEVIDFLDSDDDGVLPVRKEKKIEQEQEPEIAKKPEQTTEKKVEAKTPTISEEELLAESEDGDEEIKDEEQEESKVDSGNVFINLSEELFELGIFKDTEHNPKSAITSAEEFRDRFLLEQQVGVGEILDNFLNSKGPETREAFQYLLIDGGDPKVYMEKLAAIQDIEGLDLTIESNQEKVVRERLRRTGAKNIDSKIERLKTYGNLEEEAIEAKEILVEEDQSAIEREKEVAKDRELKKAQKKQDYYSNVSRILNDKVAKKEFDGIPVNTQFAKEVGDYITREAFKTSKGEMLTTFDKEIMDLDKPENYELKVKVAMLLKTLKTDPHLTTIQKAAVSKETKGLFGRVAQTASKTNTNIKKETKPSSWFSK